MVMKYTIYVINTFSSHTSYVKVSESMQEIRSLSFTKPTSISGVVSLYETNFEKFTKITLYEALHFECTEFLLKCTIQIKGTARHTEDS